MMKNFVKHIDGRQIRRLSTRFYYEEKQLKFRIWMEYGRNNFLYTDFDQYDHYQQQHDLLVDSMNKPSMIALKKTFQIAS